MEIIAKNIKINNLYILNPFLHIDNRFMKTNGFLISGLTLILISACASGGIISEGKPPESSVPAIKPEVSKTQPTNSPVGDPYLNPVLKIVGEEEIIFDWTIDKCEPEHIPDLAARAIRDASGNIQLIISHYINYRMVGPDFDSLESDCNPIMKSEYNADPAAYNDSEWIAAPYTDDGVIFYSLVHNEYRGHTHVGMCESGDYFDCLDTSITLAISTDSGATYQDITAAPDHLIATLPHQIEPGTGPFGHRTPSNIIKGNDGFYYSFNNVSDYETQEQWVCLMRTDTLADPKSWRFWDGKGFNGIFLDPYQNEVFDIQAHKCAPLDRNNIGASLNESITFNTYINRYVLVGISADHLDNREVWGFYYSFSDDLIHWSKRKLLLEVELPWTVDFPGLDISHLYPTLIDTASESLNFDTTGKTAYLYFTRMNNGAESLDRDLIRIQVEFFLE